MNLIYQLFYLKHGNYKPEGGKKNCQRMSAKHGFLYVKFHLPGFNNIIFQINIDGFTKMYIACILLELDALLFMI